MQSTTTEAFKKLCARVADSIAASNWVAAMSFYAQAEAVNCALELEVESAGERVRRREGLSGLKLAIEAASQLSTPTTDQRFITTRTSHNR